MIAKKCTAYCRYWHYKLGMKGEPVCKNQQKPCAEAALACELPMWKTNPIRGEYKPLPGGRKPEAFESAAGITG
jgi:hypothetical protein